ncbi:MAG: hypothetical protein KAK00_11030 [Nanoarchaeota archaeon]|nr:hypothetical protein [Nanoarchaeota archaeon]
MSQQVNLYVSKYIEGDPTIQVGLQRRLITSRVLTRHIIEEEKEFRGNFDDVRNAIRKYRSEKVPLMNIKNAYTAFKDSYIDVKSNVSFLEISRKADIEDILKIVAESFKGNESCIKISNNANSILLIGRHKDIDKLSRLIEKEDIVSVKEEISSLTIYLQPSVKHTPGIYFLIMGQISLSHINIYDISSYGSELSIYVDQKDAAKVYRLLDELIRYQMRFCKDNG